MTSKNLKRLRATFSIIGIMIGILGTFGFQILVNGPKPPVHEAVQQNTPTVTQSIQLPVCNLTEMPKPDNLNGFIAKKSEYIDDAKRYMMDNPQGGIAIPTYGGFIGKKYLIAIINSLGPDENVYYRFGQDMNDKRTCVFFQGGKFNPTDPNGPPLSEELYSRNGKAEDSFCPPHCNDPVQGK